MPLDIAARLAIHDHRSDAPASLVDVVRICGEWAGHPVPEELVESGRWEDVGARGATVATEKWDLGAEDAWAWRMRFVHPDRDDPSVLWAVEIAAVEDPACAETDVTVTLGRESRDPRVRLVRTDRPMPPRVVADLVEGEGIECADGDLPLSATPRRLVRQGVEEFALGVLLRSERRLPVVGVSFPPGADAPVLDPDRLARVLAGMAHVWLVPPDTTWALSALLPERLGVYNGAVRLWWPGLNAGSRPQDHRLWLRDAEAIDDDVIGVVLRSARQRFQPLEALAEIQRALDERDRERLAGELDELRALLDETTRPDPEVTSGAVGRLEDEIERLRSRLDQLETENADLIAELEATEEERDQLRSERYELDRRVGDLTSRLSAAGVPSGPTAAPSDPVTAFIEEIEAAYERLYMGADRERWPLRLIRLHKSFLGAVDRLGFDRRKLVEVCVHVATGRASVMDGRQVHPLRRGRAGNSEQRVRRHDNAKAWRCSLQRESPGARRLHWWALDGGGVELAHVGHHDDDTCPE